MRTIDYISYNNLVACLKTTQQTLNLYLCRAEFAHIFRFHKGKQLYLRNMTDEDIYKLKEYMTRRRGRKKGEQVIINAK